MNATPRDEHLDCAAAHEAVHSSLDEPLSAERVTVLAEHLKECEACRAYQAELAALRGALRSMPVFEFPADAREDVERATVRRSHTLERWSRGLLVRGRIGAAAAAIALIVGGVWWTSSPREQVPTDAELAQAAQQLELVLAIANRALTTVERATFQNVLGQRVLPAVKQIPLRWPTETNEAGKAETLQENGSA